MPATPNVLWAQRPKSVFITIDVQDIKGALSPGVSSKRS